MWIDGNLVRKESENFTLQLVFVIVWAVFLLLHMKSEYLIQLKIQSKRDVLVYGLSMEGIWYNHLHGLWYDLWYDPLSATESMERSIA